CGTGEGKRKLQVHHIDYDKKNSHPDNLIALCHSCHMKTNFNRSYWKQKCQVIILKMNNL
ncbi:MAG: HNH endonuclease, partial [Desulfurellales bacterium]